MTTYYKCYVCNAVSSVFSEFKAHVNRHNWLCELTVPIYCRQGDCKGSFMKLYNFFRHVGQYHMDDGELNAGSDSDFNGGPLELNQVHRHVKCGTLFDSFPQSSFDGSKRHKPEFNDMGNAEMEGVSLVASLRANSSIPYSVIPPVVESFNEMTNSLVSTCHAEAIQCLSELGSDIPADLIGNFSAKLAERFQKVKQPLQFLDSRYKQDTFFAKHDLFVSPQSINFGLRVETSCAKSKFVYDTFQYVSVEGTIRSLLMNEQYVNGLLQSMQHDVDPEVIGHYADGQQCKTHELLSDRDKFSIMIQLIYDGMGTTNPLRGQPTLCNMGVFYYVIKNLPDAWNTCFSNVHLLALCYEHDLKVHGFGPILDKFCSEMGHLSSNGFDGVFPVIGQRQIFVSLCQVACDNLALNGLLGFVQSFSGDFFCTMCYATHNSMQTSFLEENFSPRTRSEYDLDVTERGRQDARQESHARGVKRSCELNNIAGFHVTENYSMDIMHTLLEGVIPLEMGCVLYCLISEKHLFSMNDLNDQLVRFWQVIMLTTSANHPS
jgi:hypothetical protein